MLYVYNPVENLGTWHEFPGDMYNDADLQVVRDWKKANGVESKVRDEMYVQSMIKANHLDENAIVKHGTEEPTQEVIIETIKAQHPELKIKFHQQNRVVIVEQKTFLSEPDSISYIVLSLTEDSYYIDDLEVIAAFYNAHKHRVSTDHQGWMDKNDPHNLERAVRLAIKLLEQI